MVNKSPSSRWLSVLAVSGLIGCAHVSPDERKEHAEELAQRVGWEGVTLSSTPFQLHAFRPISAKAADALTVYIEGDGHAWLSARQPSPDPTPIRPLALELALTMPVEESVYLARPCQYITVPNCRTAVWTHARFSPEVIESTQVAVDQLKADARAERLVLVGFSGGGVVAALVAARRDDVAQLITVAAPLDHADWTQRLNISPLTGSLNPADEVDRLRHVPQVHFVGGRDRVVPPVVVYRFASRFPVDQKPQVVEVRDHDHLCCWPEAWASLLHRFRPLNAQRRFTLADASD